MPLIAVAGHVPHAGTMCLLRHVLSHDATSIACDAASHRDPANPLRRDGILPAVAGIEYALQAMAAHGSLTGGPGGRAGYLASLRGIALHVPRLDDVAADLHVSARALTMEATGFVYDFAVTATGHPLLTGRAAIILPDDGP